MIEELDTTLFDIVYTDWKKVFAFFPVYTINHQRVWLTTVYQRTATDPIKWDMFHDSQVVKEYATLFEVLSGQ